MIDLIHLMFPELLLCSAACVLLLMGVSLNPAVRRAAPVVALLALIVAGVSQLAAFNISQGRLDIRYDSVRVFELARFIKILSSAIGALLVMLAWPARRDGTGGLAIDYGTEAAEFFALMLFSIAGIFFVASANDIMLLFLGLELASIPTYIMVSISRPLPAAQEAGVKYFFLGAMAAALMLLGFAYLYGTTGSTKLSEIAANIDIHGGLNNWQMMAVVILIAGFTFKMAAVPMHVYAGDVYQGAATPVTAFLSFVPKISGFVALLKILHAAGGGQWQAPEELVRLMWVLSALTMSVGNVLGLVQTRNIKRVFAYSSVAHSGYMLAAVTALISTPDTDIQTRALQGVLFYLTAYGLMNLGVFGVLILLPSRSDAPATTAETYQDIAGLGRKHIVLGLAMAVSCFSLIGLPLTIGFFGKFYLISPALSAGLYWLVIILVANAAVSAAYYLRIVATLFLPADAADPEAVDKPMPHPIPILVTIGVSMVGVLWLGTIWPATARLSARTTTAAQLESPANP